MKKAKAQIDFVEWRSVADNKGTNKGMKYRKKGQTLDKFYMIRVDQKLFDKLTKKGSVAVREHLERWCRLKRDDRFKK